MSFNISESVMRHISRLDATVDFNTMSDRTIAMLRTYTKTGVIKTSGVTGKIARYIRSSNEMQYVYMRSNSMYCRNIKDKEVYDAVLAAVTMCKVKNGENHHVHIRLDEGRWYNGNIEKLMDLKPQIFSIWTQDLASHFHLTKLSDSMELDTKKSLVIDVRRFIED